MSWNSFIFFALASVLCWTAGAVLSIIFPKEKKPGKVAHSSYEKVGSRCSFNRILPAFCLSLAGSLFFFAFIIVLWHSLNRPPLRTMGETRLWYSLFLSLVGAAIYAKWHYRWILPFSALMSTVFVCINIFRPEIHSEVLMPALQSVWFVPHVIVYMFAYSLMGAATIFAVYLWWKTSRSKPSVSQPSVSQPSVSQPSVSQPSVSQPSVSQPSVSQPSVNQPFSPDGSGLKPASKDSSFAGTDLFVASAQTGDTAGAGDAGTGTVVSPEDLQICDTLVRIGWGFLTLGIVMGALWAKQAWGDYWAWDPKETWAAATWISYLLYLHLRPHLKDNRYAFALLVFSFLLLQMCWWGINYLPAAQGFSIHTY